MSKTLADTAFDAFTTCHSEDPRERWQAAAEAVADAYQMRALAPDEFTADKQQAVIKAARKVKRLQLDKSDGWTAAEQELVFAIEALDSGEWVTTDSIDKEYPE